MINKLKLFKGTQTTIPVLQTKIGDVVIKTNKYLTGKYQERNRWQAHTQQGNIV
jgi:hypothetical protein